MAAKPIHQTTLTTDDMIEEPSLPFFALEDRELVGVRSGPRIALSYISAARKSGSVTFRSFISIHMLAIILIPFLQGITLLVIRRRFYACLRRKVFQIMVKCF